MTRKEARELRSKIETAAGKLSDSEAFNSAELFPNYKEGKAYSVGDRFKHNGVLYSVVQDHTSQADWIPSNTAALYNPIPDPAIEFPEWVQPTGSHDAYMTGAKVSYMGKHWICNTDSNVYAPDVAGWTEVE